MRKTVKDSIESTIEELNKSGLLDEITMKDIKSLCLPEIKEILVGVAELDAGKSTEYIFD